MSTKESVINAKVNARVRERIKNGIPDKLHNMRYVKEPVRDLEEDLGSTKTTETENKRIHSESQQLRTTSGCNISRICIRKS